MKTWNYFFVAAFAAAFLSGCGSSPSPDQVERAVTSYVGMARPDIGEVKLDDFKILSEYNKKMEDDEVFFRQFEAHYTVSYENNRSKHSFAGTIALVKRGQQWVMRREVCRLTFADSPPLAATIKEARTDRQEEPSRRER